MRSDKPRSAPPDDLRYRAETKAGPTPPDLAALPPEEVRTVSHELQVHQLKYEMQDDELRRTRAELAASRARYFNMYELAPVGYFTLDEKGMILEANLTAATLLGVGRGELGKQPLTSFILPEDQDSYYHYRQQLFVTGAPQVGEFRMRRRGGDPLWARFEATVAKDGDGAPVCRAVLSDITERKKAAEEELLHLASFPQLNRNPVLEVTHDGLPAFQNAAIDRVVAELGAGYSALSFIPGDFKELLADFQFERVNVATRELVLGDRAFVENIHYVARTGLIRIYAMDITVRKQAEEELRESETRYRSLFENNHAVMLLIDPDSFAIVDANPAACAYYGWSRAELKKRRIDEINTLTSEEVYAEMQLARTEKRNRYFFKHRRADGTIRAVEVYSGPILLQGKTLLYSMVHDISARQRAEEALRESEARYKALFVGAAEGILVVDVATLRFCHVNPAICGMFGYTQEEFMRLGVTDIHPKESLEHVHGEFEALVRGGKEQIPNIPCRRQDGGVFFADISAALLFVDGRECVVSFFTDITVRQRAEEALRTANLELQQAIKNSETAQAQLRQSEKLAALGRLSAGIAHEMNQPLNAIKNFCQEVVLNLKERVPMSQEEIIANLMLADQQVDRMVEIITNMRIFSGRPADDIQEAFPLAATIMSPLGLIGKQLEIHGIRTEFQLAREKIMVRGNKNRMSQVFLNLMVNARDAIMEARAQSGRAARADGMIRVRSELSPDRSRIVIAISDTGVGITPEGLEMVFEPFYTTKAPDKGSGLGLAITREIIIQHKGEIRAASEYGQGSCFTITLPIAEDE